MIYNFEGLINENKIEIPMLQRDYAQGRDDGKTNKIRDEFLNSIFAVLKGEKEKLHLDFVYGSKKDGKFIPLDGQQRLTTLFLLHWYFGFDELKDGEKSNILKDGEKKSKFVYETRVSSREFCDMLVNLERKKLQNGEKISAQIKDNAKFLPFWGKDPTVKSMLNMLDAIHEKAKDKNITEIDEQTLKKIDFDFLNMGEYGLTDELYIKMNARGKRLTEFENFKAKFEDLLEKAKFEDLLKEFKEKIDGKWAKIFWNFKDETNKNKNDYNPAISADNAFMTYFYYISEMLFCRDNKNTEKEAKDDEKIEFDKNKALEIYENSKENIVFLFRALDNINEIEKEANEIFAQIPIYWGDKQKSNEDTKFIKKIENFGVYEKILYFIIMNNYAEIDKAKNLIRKARNIMSSIKQPDWGRSGISYKTNLRTQDIWSILNFINDFSSNALNLDKFKERNKDLFKEIKNIDEMQDIRDEIEELEDSEIFQGDLGAVHSVYGASIEKYKNLLNNVKNIFTENKVAADDILGTILIKSGFIWHGSAGQFGKYFIGSNLKNSWNFIFSNNDDKKYKEVIELFSDEKLNPKSICEAHIYDCEKENNRDWKYYFIKYRKEFFKETNIKFSVYDDKKDEIVEQENGFRNVFIKRSEKLFEMEKMGSQKMPVKYFNHFNPFIYCTLKENIEKEFEKSTELENRKYFIKYDNKKYSYAKIENFIEKLYCLDDGWHIYFDKEIRVSDEIREKFGLNAQDEGLVLTHSPDIDTIENLKSLLGCIRS